MNGLSKTRTCGLPRELRVGQRKPRAALGCHRDLDEGKVNRRGTANFAGLVLGCFEEEEEEEESRSVFKKKENLGVCAKQKIRLTYFGKY